MSSMLKVCRQKATTGKGEDRLFVLNQLGQDSVSSYHASALLSRGPFQEGKARMSGSDSFCLSPWNETRCIPPHLVDNFLARLEEKGIIRSGTVSGTTKMLLFLRTLRRCPMNHNNERCSFPLVKMSMFVTISSFDSEDFVSMSTRIFRETFHWGANQNAADFLNKHALDSFVKTSETVVRCSRLE